MQTVLRSRTVSAIEPVIRPTNAGECMWCIVYQGNRSDTEIDDALEEHARDVVRAKTLDEVLDALWFHGSEVECLVLEANKSDDFDEFDQALDAWPKMRVLVYGENRPKTLALSGMEFIAEPISPESVLRYLGVDAR